ncbi:MAG: 2-oxo acid dehydrogenase subunit E2 [Chloroflexi bacterium]|nr:2-oxo acid dehydrogenase subunit E2 [Chloroflexota bacterium]
MAMEVTMPQMGFDMKEGKLLRWLKKEGQAVNRGEALAEIETDKASVEAEAFQSGVLLKTLVKEGETVPVGTVIAYIGEAGEKPPTGAPSAPKAAAAPTPTAPAQPPPAAPAAKPAPAQQATPATTGELKVSPIARKVAEEHGVNLRQVKGTGPGGRVQKDDVLNYVEAMKKGAVAPAAAAPAAPAAAGAPAVAQRLPLSKMRQTIARRMTQSKQQVPHFYVEVEMDMTEAMRFRKELNETASLEAKVSVNDLIVKASALALLKFPHLNATYSEEGVQVHPQINIGIAIALEDGLIAPAILDCGRKSLGEIAKASKSLQERAKGGALKPEEYGGATFTVTNLGMFDVENFIAIIPPVQGVSLAVGTVKARPIAQGEQVVVRQTMRGTLSADHRLTDGAVAAQFLMEVKALLQNPLRLIL